MIKYFFLFFLSCFSYCGYKQTAEKFIFAVDDATEEKVFSIKLKRKYSYQEMVIKENTLDDTCLIGIMKVPPGKTGLQYRIEFFSDSLLYQYKPYKATKGRLAFDHSFMDSY